MKKKQFYCKTVSETKDRIVEQTVILLESELRDEIKEEVLKDPLFWLWTEIPNNGALDETKYTSIKYWSESAIKHWNAHKIKRGLIHEHIIPRSVLAEGILKMWKDIQLEPSRIKIQFVREFYEEFVRAAVVLKSADKFAKGLSSKLPKIDCEFLWGRYIESNIKMFEVEYFDNHITPKSLVYFDKYKLDSDLNKYIFF